MTTRFDRQLVIPGWDQDALGGATVVVAGVGALGNEVARILAMSGVSRLILCDPDHVEASNLSRAVLFQESDLGRPKVAAAADSLHRLAPGTSVVTRAQRLVHGVGLADLRDASLVLSCLDSRSARLQLAGRCGLVGAPCIDGGTNPWGGEVRPYLKVDGPCYGCGLTPSERATVDAPWSCHDLVEDDPAAASAPVSVLVGAWMATLALRFLMGIGCANEILRIDAARGSMARATQRRDPNCPLHSRVGELTPLPLSTNDSVGQLRKHLPRGAVPLLWEAAVRMVDCRTCGFKEERWEMRSDLRCPRCGSVLRPGTTLELDRAPDEVPLARLGVAPREILAVRREGGFSWIELRA